MSIFSDIGNAISGAVGGVVSGVEDAVKGAVGGVEDLAKGLGQLGAGALSGNKSEMMGGVKDIGSGVGSLAGAATNETTLAADALLSGAESALGSPSSSTTGSA